jgi:hypothetical protein
MAWYFVNTGITLPLLYLIRGPFEKFVDSPYYSESKLRGGAVTVSFSKCLPLANDALLTTFHPLLENVLLFAASFRKIVEQAVLTF